jgi:hypothetical protein
LYTENPFRAELENGKKAVRADGDWRVTGSFGSHKKSANSGFSVWRLERLVVGFYLHKPKKACDARLEEFEEFS